MSLDDLDCTCTVTQDDVITDEDCPYHGKDGPMIVKIHVNERGVVFTPNPPPLTLQRLDSQDAMIAVLRAGNKVRGGFHNWLRGAPTHVLAELMNELRDNGYYLGKAVVNDDNRNLD